MNEPIAIVRSPTPVSYAQAIADLPTSQIHGELNRLAISEEKLKSTNAQLSADEFKDEQFAQEAIAENTDLLQSYVWRRAIIHKELSERGAIIPQNGTHLTNGSANHSASADGPETGSAGIEL